MSLRLRHPLSIVVLLLATCSGCFSSGPPREVGPSFDPAAIGAAAVKEYDTNGDGAISGPELDKVPGILNALEHYDTNGDKRVTADTIAARVRQWQDSLVQLTTISCNVMLDHKPLEGATVTYEPEKFMGSELSPATGKTSATGTAAPQMQDKHGIRLGLYKVRISKLGADGKEMLPAQYNTDTTLGDEVAPNPGEQDHTTFQLKSK
jgi:hypothetical protein